jgi:hypothetical protein
MLGEMAAEYSKGPKGQNTMGHFTNKPLYKGENTVNTLYISNNSHWDLVTSNLNLLATNLCGEFQNTPLFRFQFSAGLKLLEVKGV